jgi:hypothetical protein
MVQEETMIPTVILYALTMWQQGQTKPITTTGDSDKTLQGGGLITPFDVPPVEWDGPDTLGSRYEKEWKEPCRDRVGETQPPCKTKIHHRVCADKSRFLLMSEDGKWHCLRLEGK